MIVAHKIERVDSVISFDLRPHGFPPSSRGGSPALYVAVLAGLALRLLRLDGASPEYSGLANDLRNWKDASGQIFVAEKRTPIEFRQLLVTPTV